MFKMVKEVSMVRMVFAAGASTGGMLESGLSDVRCDGGEPEGQTDSGGSGPGRLEVGTGFRRRPVITSNRRSCTMELKCEKFWQRLR
jgi:hypothetical protein